MLVDRLTDRVRVAKVEALPYTLANSKRNARVYKLRDKLAEV